MDFSPAFASIATVLIVLSGFAIMVRAMKTSLYIFLVACAVILTVSVIPTVLHTLSLAVLIGVGVVIGFLFWKALL